jgi:hypothetical protein
MWGSLVIAVLALVMAVFAIILAPQVPRIRPDVHPDLEVTAAVREVRANLPEHPAKTLARPPVPTAGSLPQREPDSSLVSPPPLIDDVPLRDWLIHYSQRDNVWSDVVRDFYDHAAAVPEIADYFRNTDMERQRQHFCRALAMVASNGLRQGTVEWLRELHRERAHASTGAPITAEVYDAVINTLMEVLINHGVPQRGRQALAVTIAPLRAELVRA